jgi:integral membrane protein (TIGR00529 family)
MAVPSVVGLIPMPAGALFSAPLVERASEGAESPGEWKTAVNYWFRHVWEYWWPLYPGVIVAMSIFDMPAWQFFAAQIPFSAVAFAAGYLFLIRSHVGPSACVDTSGRPSYRRAFVVLLPLAIVVGTVLFVPFGLERLLPAMGRSNRRLLAMLTGLLLGLVLIVYDERRLGKRGTFSTLRRKRSLGVLFTIAGVMVFRHMLERSGLIPVACEEMQQSRIALPVVVATLPLLAGFVTGIAVGFTSISLPLVVGLTLVEGSTLTPMATLVLAYGFGYMGMMISPVHLCLVVTREYFSAPFTRVYRRIVPCVLAILGASVGSHLVYRFLGW